MVKKLLFIVFTLICYSASAQTGRITGKVISGGKALPYATVQVNGTIYGSTTDEEGDYEIMDVPFGNYTITASFLGYEDQKYTIQLNDAQRKLEMNFELSEFNFLLDQIVVTGTRTSKRRTQSPVIVNVIDNATLNNVQACNLSEGLKFQPGLRVETNCQTCNYTQLRMNGLGGGYSQILINGRPIFSPLTGLYGMEQIPTNMIERIEVVRGGGSALYGSSAIGGTVNVITRIPKVNSFDLAYTYQNIHGTGDQIVSGNGTLVSKSAKSGASFYLNNRLRDWYDHNGDNFSELPRLENNSFGTTLFFRPSENQKLEMNLSSINEYRYGGEMVNQPAHFTLQSEERTHRVLVGNIDYMINFNDYKNSLITYVAAQRTERDHYTGIFPDNDFDIARHLEEPPYGISLNTTYQAGLQLNHLIEGLGAGNTVLTGGIEYVSDDILDVIEAYNYKIDQKTQTFGAFLQSDMEISPKFNLLTGIRADRHNLVNRTIFSPRISFLFKPQEYTQLRMTWGTGFRAPQAFDTDLHIAFAGGGVSRISLSPNLKEERSNSFSSSINFDLPTENYILGFTREGFYTQLDNAFYLQPTGEDPFGETFQKRNGEGASVQGATLELRANFFGKYQLETGYTIQSSLYDQPVEYIEGLELKKEFLRTPNHYGFATLTLNPSRKLSTTINLVYTGKMQLVHFAGAPEQQADQFKTSDPFTDVSFRSGYTIDLKNINSGLEIFGGIRNIFNSYQNDFDSGKNRDSNYVYGPSLPRTLFMGVRFKSL